MSLDPKPSPCPWFAIWRAEKGTFAQLPLMARALFCEVLKLTDDDGYIELGDREPAEAIAYALGADRSDRRMLAKYVPMLLRDGCLVRDDARLYAPNFKRWQPGARRETTTGPRTDRDAAANEPRTSRDAVTMDPRRGHDAVTTEPRACHETEGKSAESLQVDSQSRVEESRGDERAATAAYACAREGRPTGPIKAGPRPVKVTDLDAAQRRLWQMLDAASWRWCRGPLAGEHTKVREAATWIWQIVGGNAAAWEPFAERLLARWEADSRVQTGEVQRAAAHFLSCLPNLRDAVLGTGAAAPVAPPPELSRYAALRDRLKALKAARDDAWGRGDHDRVQALEAQQNEVRAELRALKGAA